MSNPFSDLAEGGAPQSWKRFAASYAEKGTNGAKYFRRAFYTYVSIEATYEMGRHWYRQARQRVAYTITVPEDDEIYPALHKWMISQIPERRLRSLVARVQRDRNQVDDFTVNYKSVLNLFYDGRSEIAVEIEGHKVRVAIERESKGPVQVLSMEGDRSQKKKWVDDRIVFTAYGYEARNAVIAMLRGLAEELNSSSTQQPRFFLASQWADWNRRQDLSTRTIDTVVLRDGQMDELVSDLETFLARKDDYDRLGIPWHRGYLLHGPPGTGKTSIPKALATHFGLDIYYVSLGDLEKDQSLLQLLGNVSERSILLLEDIDVIAAAHDRDEGAEQPLGITLSGLLNSLDGLVTPSGLITFMTTNRRAVLDDALIRAGRIDRVEYVGYVDDEQLQRLVKLYLGAGLHLPPVGNYEIAPAMVAEVFKRNMDQSRAVLEGELKKLIRSGHLEAAA